MRKSNLLDTGLCTESACCRLFAIWQGLAYKSSWIRAGVHRSRRCSSDLGLSVQPPKETAHHQLLKTFPRRTTHAMDTSSCAVAKLFGGGVMGVLAVDGQFAWGGLKTSINTSLKFPGGQETFEWVKPVSVGSMQLSCVFLLTSAVLSWRWHSSVNIAWLDILSQVEFFLLLRFWIMSHLYMQFGINTVKGLT